MVEMAAWLSDKKMRYASANISAPRGSGLGLIAFCGLLAQLSAIRWLKLQEARMTLVGKLLFHGRQVMLLRL